MLAGAHNRNIKSSIVVRRVFELLQHFVVHLAHEIRLGRVFVSVGGAFELLSHLEDLQGSDDGFWFCLREGVGVSATTFF